MNHRHIRRVSFWLFLWMAVMLVPVVNADDTIVDIRADTLDGLKKNSLIIDFKEGSALLSPSEKSELKAMVKTRNPAAETVAIAAWSDRSYPAERNARLPTTQVSLAAKRADAVKNYLNALAKFHDFKIHNMAEQSGFFGRLFKTDDAQVKSAVKGDEVGDYEARYVSKVILDQGKQSAAVVIFYNEKQLAE